MPENASHAHLPWTRGERLWVGLLILGLIVLVTLGLWDLRLYAIAHHATQSTFN